MNDRHITENDIHAKARIMAEGVRIEGVRMPSSAEFNKVSGSLPEKLDFDNVEGIWKTYAETVSVWEKSSRQASGLSFHFDGSGIKVMVQPNDYSRLELRREGDQVTVLDGDETLITGVVPKTLDWMDRNLSNGLPMSTVMPAVSSEIINVVFSLSCANFVSGKDACRYCNLFANPLSKRLLNAPSHVLKSWASYQAEAVKVAIDSGWEGLLSLSAGAFHPSRRGEYLERMTIVLGELREVLGHDTYSKQKILFNYYPPEDFADMHQWKKLGVTATSIDLEVMDPAYFAAICPGKHAFRPLEYWKEAQEASVEVFGPYMNTMGCVVAGIEPMTALVEGVEERLSKGVMPFPITFYSAPGSAYWGFRPPTADWFVEASQRMADSFMSSAGFLQCVAEASGGAMTGSSSALTKYSSPMTLVFDEVLRRVQQLFGQRGELAA